MESNNNTGINKSITSLFNLIKLDFESVKIRVKKAYTIHFGQGVAIVLILN